MRRLAIAAVVLIAVLAAVSAGFGFWAWGQFTKPGPLTEQRTLVIPACTGGAGIARLLANAGIIADARLFRFGHELWSEPAPLRAGEYAFTAAISARDAIRLLQSGRTVMRRLTVPEGWTVAEVGTQLVATEGLVGDVGPLPPEGSLLPETYHFAFGDRRADLLRRMTSSMSETLDQLWPLRQRPSPLASPEEAIILASIVEKETGIAAERPRVAAVFLNRLRRGMRLQSDPTVVYGLTLGQRPLGRALTRDDLNSPTPYNTYQIDRLPPGPIANPGRAAIEAVLNPVQSTEYYFVADGTGGHVFSRTLAEHNRNVARWRKFMKQQAKPAKISP